MTAEKPNATITARRMLATFTETRQLQQSESGGDWQVVREDAPLDRQINEWVTKTGNIIVDLTFETKVSAPTSSQRLITRTALVVFMTAPNWLETEAALRRMATASPMPLTAARDGTVALAQHAPDVPAAEDIPILTPQQRGANGPGTEQPI